MNFDTEDIKFKALELSYYCPPYKKDIFIESFKLDDFNVDKAKECVRNSVSLLSYSKIYRPLVIEILDVLAQNKYDFLIEHHKYISFYWSGIPILQFIINSGTSEDRQLHISLQKYKNEKIERLSDMKLNRIFILGIVGSLVIGGFLTALTFFRSKN